MSLKDKLEIGLKPDAPYRPDNLPETEPARSRTLRKRAGRVRVAARPAAPKRTTALAKPRPAANRPAARSKRTG